MSKKKCLAYIEINKSYHIQERTELLFVHWWLHLFDCIYFLWVWLYSLWRVVVTKETATFGLSNTFIEIKFNACFSSALHCLMQIPVICFLITKYLHIICYTNSTLAILICLINLLLKDVLIHPQPKRHPQELEPPKWCVECCHK